MLYKPKVFMSYSHTSESHEKDVLSLSKKLMADGIDVVLDQWELYPGYDQYDFMERISKDKSINKIIIICDSGYQNKADNNLGGVGVEGQILKPDIYKNTEKEKYIPVIFEKSKEGVACVPVFLKNRMYIDLSSKNYFSVEYESLVRDIFNKRKEKKPNIGYPPIYVIQDEVSDEDYRDDPFFIFGLEKAVRVTIGVNDVFDRAFGIMEIYERVYGEHTITIRFERDGHDYFRFDIYDTDNAQNYAEEVYGNFNITEFWDNEIGWFRKGTIIWIGLKAFKNTKGKDIVFAISGDGGSESYLHVLRKNNCKWELIANLGGQDKYFLEEDRIFIKIGSQGAGEWYKMTDRGVFEVDSDAYRSIE